MNEAQKTVFLRRATRRSVLGLMNIALGTLAVSLGSQATRAAAPGGGKWVCTNADCDPYVYDPSKGDADNIAHPGHPIPAGLSFEDLPHDWICPSCGSGKEFFRPLAP